MGTLKKAVIIGGGLIGVEMTEALTKRGLQVTLVETLPHLLPGLLDPETAVFFDPLSPFSGGGSPLRGKGLLPERGRPGQR